MDSQFIIGKSSLAMYSPSWGSARSPADDEDAAAPATAASSSASPAAAKAAQAEQTKTGGAEKAQPSDKLYAASMSKRNVGPEASDGDLTFDDFVDIINPLQHIPVVNMIYREITGDKISGMAQIVGSTLLGGPLGMVSGVIGAIFEQETGKGLGETAVAMLTGSDFGDNTAPGAPSAPGTAAPPPVMVAEAPEADEAAPETEAVAENEAAESTPIAVAEANTETDTQAENPGPAQKAAFGGVIARPAPSPVKTAAAAANAPVYMGLTEISGPANGPRFFPMKGVHRMAGGTETRMPIADSPDVQLKPINRQRVVHPPVAAAPPAIPLASKEQAQQILNIDDAEGNAVAAMAQTHTANPLPPQLIQDMMLMNLEKYKNGGGSMNGAARGSSVDIEG